MWSPTSTGLLIIRIGLGGVLLWFGIQQLLAPELWVGYIPPFVLAYIQFGAQTLVLLNGSAEITAGVLMLLGVFTRVVAFIMGVHLVLIALSLGYTPNGVRDWGLAIAMLGLAVSGGGMFSLDSRHRRQLS